MQIHRNSKRLKEEKEFKVKDTFIGIFLPVNILLLDDLTVVEKVILSYIFSITMKSRRQKPVVFQASNFHISRLLDVSQSTVSSAFSRLEKFEYIVVLAPNGRARRVVCDSKLVKLKNDYKDKKIDMRARTQMFNYPDADYEN